MTAAAAKPQFRFVVILPILNAEKETGAFLAALECQTLKPEVFFVIHF